MIRYSSNYFLILTRGRAGSHWLATSLDSHPHVNCFCEAFNVSPRPVKGVFRRDDEVKNDFYKYAKRLNLNVPNVGFQMIYEQMWNELEHDKVKVIRLMRRNLFKQYLSMKIANRTRVFHIEDQNSKRRLWVPEKNPSVPPLKIECEFCETYMRSTLKRNAEIEEKFKDRVDVFYEDLMEDFDKETRRIQEFLGIEPMTLTSPLKKLKYLPNQILNYEEVKSYFKGTQFHWMFDD